MASIPRIRLPLLPRTALPGGQYGVYGGLGAPTPPVAQRPIIERGPAPGYSAGGIPSTFPVGGSSTAPQFSPLAGLAALAAGHGATAAPAGSAAAPPVDLWAQAGARASSLYAPLIKSITDAIAGQRIAGEGAIKSATDALAGAYGSYAPASHAIYQGAQQQQTAADTALNQQLRGQGSALQAGLAGQLAHLGQDTAPAAALGQYVTGAANANANKASAGLASLIARGATAEDQAARLPAQARASGLQNTANFEGQIGGKLATELSALNQLIPGATSSIYGNLQSQANRQTDIGRQDARYAKTDAAAAAAAREKVREFNVGDQRKQQAAEIGAWTKQYLGKLANAAKAKALTERISHDKATEANQNASIEQRRQAAQDRAAAQREQAGLRQQQLQVSQGQLDEKTRHDQAMEKAAAARVATKGGYSKVQVQRYQGTADKIAQGAYHGFTESAKGTGYPGEGWQPVYQTDAGGKPVADTAGKQTILGWQRTHAQLTYQQALAEMQHGDPKYGAIPKAIAVAALNQIYKPGERGRPQSAVQKKQAAAADTYTKGLGIQSGIRK